MLSVLKSVSCKPGASRELALRAPGPCNLNGRSVLDKARKICCQGKKCNIFRKMVKNETISVLASTRRDPGRSEAEL